MAYQQTIKNKISFYGIGLHTGDFCKVELIPAVSDTGIVFVVRDTWKPLKECHIHNTQLKTTLCYSYSDPNYKVAYLYTVEHLLGALHGLGIDNIVIKLTRDEIPIFDGSAKEITSKILEAGIKPLNAVKSYTVIKKKHTIGNEEDNFISVEPYNGLFLDVSIKFDHPLINKQNFKFELSPEAFVKELSEARTFATKEIIEFGISRGLLKGGNPYCAIILNDKSTVNGPLRWKDEFVRHKTLDLLGDLYVKGPLKAKIKACCNGHYLNSLLLMEIPYLV